MNDMALSDIHNNATGQLYTSDGKQANLLYDIQGNAVSQSAVTQRFRSFTILGDSYSTFKGYSFSPYYPDSVTGGNDVSKVEHTWWKLLAQETGMKIAQNNSLSGSAICYDSWGSGNTDNKPNSFVTRCRNLTDADIIFIFGGTNDSWVGVSIGEYKYIGWEEADFVNFRPSLAYVCHHIKGWHPNAQIVFVKNSGFTADIVSSIDTICAYYGIPVLNLDVTVGDNSEDKNGGHPNQKGMIKIKDQIIAFLETL